MSKKHPAILSIEDFIFYVIFTSVGGYGNHPQRNMRKFSRKHLVGETVRNGRFKQTEWCSISDSDFGMAEIKYTGILTYNGIKEFIDNFWAADAEKTMGSLTEFGLLSAISLQTRCGWEMWYERLTVSEKELQRRFKSKYNKAIYMNQRGEEMNAYISPFVMHSRIDEVFRSLFGENYMKDPKFHENKHAAHILMKIDELCKKLEDFIVEFNDRRNGAEELNISQFTVDCRQLELFEGM